MNDVVDGAIWSHAISCAGQPGFEGDFERYILLPSMVVKCWAMGIVIHLVGIIIVLFFNPLLPIVLVLILILNPLIHVQSLNKSVH